MRKAANIYSTSVDALNAHKRKRGVARPAARQSARPSGKAQAAAFAVLASLTFTLCLTINYRAYSEMSREIDENRNLSFQVETLTTENLSLQEEVHYLKSDSHSIRREARKIGLLPGKENVSVPTDR